VEIPDTRGWTGPPLGKLPGPRCAPRFWPASTKHPNGIKADSKLPCIAGGRTPGLTGKQTPRQWPKGEGDGKAVDLLLVGGQYRTGFPGGGGLGPIWIQKTDGGPRVFTGGACFVSNFLGAEPLKASGLVGHSRKGLGPAERHLVRGGPGAGGAGELGRKIFVENFAQIPRGPCHPPGKRR